jgi:hypothetical protein
MKRTLAIIGLLAAVLIVSAEEDCYTSESAADKSQREKQEAMSLQSNQQVGTPGVTTFTEKRLVRRLYELRDQNIATFTYVVDMEGKLHHLCDSIGYGLPYGVQYTNPEAHRGGASGNYGYNIPQPEPNGLFMPPTAEGTWVMCAGPKGEPMPVYVEPRVIVSPFKLNTWAEYQVGGKN